MHQQTFNPIRYGFSFEGDWYKFNYEASHKAALKARNAEAKALRKEGRKVKCWTLKNQRMSQGGIGSGFPHIELTVTVYGLTVI